MNGFCVELCCSYCKSYDNVVVLCMNILNENVCESTLYNVIAKSMWVSWLKSFAMQEIMFAFWNERLVMVVDGRNAPVSGLKM